MKLLRVNQYIDRDLSVFTDNLSLPRHRWYEFKEGFSEKLVLKAIEDAPGETRRLRILDPFAGSGTTLVTAGRTGHEATGIEVNPFLAFVSQAKCVAGGWSQSEFEFELNKLLEVSRHEIPSPLEGLSTFTEKPGIEKWLFNHSVLRGFAALDDALSSTVRYADPLKLALMASLMECCNAKRDGKCLRYRRGWKSLGFDSSSLREVFGRRARMVADDIVQHEFEAQGLRLLEGDARERLGDLEGEQYDLVVTSPPYLNSSDYCDIYRPELFAGGFVKTNEDLREIRLKTVRSHVQVKWEPAPIISSDMLVPVLKQLSARKLWDYRLPDMVQSYFVDISNVLQQTADLVRRNGKAWIVVSTSAYAGIQIPVDLILADIGAQNGWKLIGIFVLRYLRSAGQQWARLEAKNRMPLRESLVVLQR